MFGLFKKSQPDISSKPTLAPEEPISQERIQELWAFAKRYEDKINILPRAAALTLPCVKCGSGEKKKVEFIPEQTIYFDKHGGSTYSWNAVIDWESHKHITAKLGERLTAQCIDCGYQTTTKTMDAKEAPHA